MDKYTKFILTVIAVAMIGILFKGEKIITSAHAIESHQHRYQDIHGKGGGFIYVVQEIVKRSCFVRGSAGEIGVENPIIFGRIDCNQD